MKPHYAARIEDLGPGDFVKVECIACGHELLIPPVGLLHGCRLPPITRVMDLEPRLRRRECDARGKAVVTVVNSHRTCCRSRPNGHVSDRVGAVFRVYSPVRWYKNADRRRQSVAARHAWRVRW
jgi:hypothetical protein